LLGGAGGTAGVSQEEIFVGLGSSEILILASRVLLRAGLQGLTSEGHTRRSPWRFRASGAELGWCRSGSLRFDLKAMSRAIHAEDWGIYLANPNNDGKCVHGKEFEEFLSERSGWRAGGSG